MDHAVDSLTFDDAFDGFDDEDTFHGLSHAPEDERNQVEIKTQGISLSGEIKV